MKDAQAVGTTPMIPDTSHSIAGGLSVDSTMTIEKIDGYCSSDPRDTRKVSDAFNRVNADGHNG